MDIKKELELFEEKYQINSEYIRFRDNWYMAKTNDEFWREAARRQNILWEGWQARAALDR